jgi:2-oxoisovalerate ferredoxin oxidoreductase beta subunit
MYTVAHRKPESFFPLFALKDGDPSVTHYCPGCGHGALHKFIAEAIDDLGIQNRTILVSPVGCSVFAYHYFDVGNVQSAHGRAPAVATGIKRSRPESIVLSYQGDGDLASIGTAEIIHAANRGENISVFFVNNAIYGMTGGQMAPTTLLGQKTSTTPLGRNAMQQGFPLKICEMLSSLEGAAYLERVALFGSKNHMKARAAVRKAIRYQMEGRGFSLVEVLSACPTGWKLKPADAWRWIEEQMLPVFPLAVYKDTVVKIPSSPGGPLVAPSPDIPSCLDLKSNGNNGSPDKGKKANELQFHSIKIAGFGGQGVLSLGVILATAAMREGYRTSWLPSYGPEMRGGTAHCNVILSPREIGCPLADLPEILVVMNSPSLVRFHSQVKAGGLILYDSSLIKVPPRDLKAGAVGVPASQLAYDLGETKVANIVLLGALMARIPFLSQESIHLAIDENLRNDRLRQLNREAFELGRNYCVTESAGILSD